MSIISEIKCARCDRKYSGIRSRCPYCGASRIGRGKFSEDSDNSRGKMLIGVMIMAALVIASGFLLFTTPPQEQPDGYVASAHSPSEETIPGESENMYYSGTQDVELPVETENSPEDFLKPMESTGPTVRSASIVYGARNTVKTDITEKIGNKLPLKLIVEPLGTTDEIIWTSSNESVFQVTPSNTEGTQVTVVGLDVGWGTLTASVGGVEAKCIIRIKK